MTMLRPCGGSGKTAEGWVHLPLFIEMESRMSCAAALSIPTRESRQEAVLPFILRKLRLIYKCNENFYRLSILSPIFLLYIRSIGGVTTAFNLQFDILPRQRKAHFSTHKRVLKWAFHIDSLQTEDFQKRI